MEREKEFCSLSKEIIRYLKASISAAIVSSKKKRNSAFFTGPPNSFDFFQMQLFLKAM